MLIYIAQLCRTPFMLIYEWNSKLACMATELLRLWGSVVTYCITEFISDTLRWSNAPHVYCLMLYHYNSINSDFLMLIIAGAWFMAHIQFWYICVKLMVNCLSALHQQCFLQKSWRYWASAKHHNNDSWCFFLHSNLQQKCLASIVGFYRYFALEDIYFWAPLLLS